MSLEDFNKRSQKATEDIAAVDYPEESFSEKMQVILKNYCRVFDISYKFNDGLYEIAVPLGTPKKTADDIYEFLHKYDDMIEAFDYLAKKLKDRDKLDDDSEDSAWEKNLTEIEKAVRDVTNKFIICKESGKKFFDFFWDQVIKPSDDFLERMDKIAIKGRNRISDYCKKISVKCLIDDAKDTITIDPNPATTNEQMKNITLFVQLNNQVNSARQEIRNIYEKKKKMDIVQIYDYDITNDLKETCILAVAKYKAYSNHLSTLK